MSNVPEHLTVRVTVNKNRGPFDLRLYEGDRLDLICERAMKGVPTQQQNVVYSAFVSGISQQLLDWALMLHGRLKETGATNDEYKKRFTDARRILTQQMAQINDKDKQIKQLKKTISDMEAQALIQPAPVSPMDAKWVKKEMERLRARNEQLEGLSIMYALEDNADSNIMELGDAYGVEGEESDYLSSSSSSENGQEEGEGSGVATSKRKRKGKAGALEDPMHIIQQLKTELHYAKLKILDYEKKTKLSEGENSVVNRKHLRLENDIKAKECEIVELENRIESQQSRQKRGEEKLQQTIHELKESHAKELHSSIEEHKSTLQAQDKVHERKFLELSDELKGVQLANELLSKKKGVATKANVSAQTTAVEFTEQSTSINEPQTRTLSTQTKPSKNFPAQRKAPKAQSIDSDQPPLAPQTSTSAAQAGPNKIQRKGAPQQPVASETSASSALGSAPRTKSSATRTNGSVPGIKSSTAKAQCNAPEETMECAEPSIDPNLLKKLQEGHQDEMDRVVMESLQAQKKKLQERFQKEMMSQSRAAEEEKKRALQKTVDRLNAQHRAELAIAAKMGQSASSSKPASGRKGSSSQRNEDAGGGGSASDSGPESDDEEKLQFQRQQEKMKKMRAEAEDGMAQPKFSMQAKQKINMLTEQANEAEREKNEIKNKYNATLAVLTDLERKIEVQKQTAKEKSEEVVLEKRSLKEKIENWQAEYYGQKTQNKVDDDRWAEKYHKLGEDKEIEKVRAIKEMGTMVLIQKAHVMFLCGVKLSTRAKCLAFQRWWRKTCFHRDSAALLWRRLCRYAKKRTSQSFKRWLGYTNRERELALVREKDDMRVGFWKQQAELQKNWSKTNNDCVQRAVDRETKNNMYETEIRLQRAIHHEKVKMNAEWNKERAEQALKLARVHSKSIEKEVKHKNEITRLREQSNISWPHPPKPLYDGKDRLFESIRENIELLRHDLGAAMERV